MKPIEKVLAALREHDCDPRQIGPGLWLAICPACRDEGPEGFLEIHVMPDDHVELGCELREHA